MGLSRGACFWGSSLIVDRHGTRSWERRSRSAPQADECHAADAPQPSASVCAVLVVADAHSAAELKQACVEYIVRNFPAMHQTDDFRELPRPLMEAVHAALSSALFGGRSSGGSGVGMAVG